MEKTFLLYLLVHWGDLIEQIKKKYVIYTLSIPEFLKTGLAKIRAHLTTWQLKAMKSVQRPIKKPISDAEQ